MIKKVDVDFRDSGLWICWLGLVCILLELVCQSSSNIINKNTRHQLQLHSFYTIIEYNLKKTAFQVDTSRKHQKLHFELSTVNYRSTIVSVHPLHPDFTMPRIEICTSGVAKAHVLQPLREPVWKGKGLPSLKLTVRTWNTGIGRLPSLQVLCQFRGV